jgi:hypothetical protein
MVSEMAKKAKKATQFVMQHGNKLVWGQIGVEPTVCDIRKDACPFCGKVALVELPKFMLKVQPDDTTIVCHPAIGGCNQGFAKAG